MSPFLLYLWREWREQRRTLGLLALVLPLLGLFFSHLPPRPALAEPLLQSGAALAFVVVVLVASGGELLGAERREAGLRWLERLPAGLSTAFRAKLLFLVLTVALAAVYGLGVARALALLRGIEPRSLRWETWSFLAVLALALWTFACSAWALRGGVALLAATLVIGLIGHPVWRVVHAGYGPGPGEFLALACLLLVAALSSAWLGFVRGARRGGSTARVALLALAPVLPVLGATWSWSAVRLAEPAVFAPASIPFRMRAPRISADGKVALGVGYHVLEGWRADAMPNHAVRIELDTGVIERLGREWSLGTRYLRGSDGHTYADEIVISCEDAGPFAFAETTGAARPFDLGYVETRPSAPCGLGEYLLQTRDEPAVVRDPFRERDFLVSELKRLDVRGKLLVRPGRWLVSRSRLDWSWVEPETGVSTPVEWPTHSEPLVLFQDGGILLANSTSGLELVHPERGEVRPVRGEAGSIALIRPNPHGLRVPEPTRTADDFQGTIVLQTHAMDWLVLDPEAETVRRLPVPESIRFLRRIDERSVVVEEAWPRWRLLRLELESGELTPLWPRASD